MVFRYIFGSAANAGWRCLAGTKKVRPQKVESLSEVLAENPFPRALPVSHHSSVVNGVTAALEFALLKYVIEKSFSLDFARRICHLEGAA